VRKDSSANFSSRFLPILGKPRFAVLMLISLYPEGFGQGMGTTHQRDGHRRAVRKSGTPGHPARGRYLSRQVSWLAGHHRRPSSRGVFLSDILDDNSPLTVAGAAPAWMPQGIVTEFPLSSGSYDPQNHDKVHNGGKGRNGQSHKEIFMWRAISPLALCGTRTSAFRQSSAVAGWPRWRRIAVAASP
jgi:hypothetical protein